MTKSPSQTASETVVSPRVQQHIIDDERAGQRLDNYLISQLKGVPKTLVYRIIRKGEVRINKGRTKPDYRLKEGDTVRIPPVRVANKATPKAGKRLTESIEASILYEDERIIVINKPSGLAVHGGSGINLGLIEALRDARPDQKYLELVHRLDRDTSGCLMIAKKRSALRDLHEQIRNDRVNKVYWALVEGRWANRKQQVNAPLKKNTLQSGERVVRVDPEGKPSLTRFRVLEPLKGSTLIEATPVTGRTHQIRVHALHAGHSIIGDDKYTPREVNMAFREQGIKRLFLHAAALEINLPGSGKRQRFNAPLPEELEQGLKALRNE
ncbi:23S rRNA pseudouridine(955/2504/2580) synthase RluC [Aestuariirhabdus sp. Z084]|uniref:23S rRNA pseudouridine(955/2504/2580) synthase RluC n=1 Tax=Aestuariirhabdus haliotis TaxID=2918751 RepID=UPI00201B399F|nr:23S rRNA pseudouridine(955/2504/2580) synthase RluC [Aestuariirhabdus haliotis]MCL6414794.1 23S rRNA pseudouridine(955/2504/2580) synthase RluC [Aestuariirhabdus haliotis]MCL6418726.1 23S rRNA pseudouridine(955/2504/2580) synthase RluC [Aestuariirhabdus haliotis]